CGRRRSDRSASIWLSRSRRRNSTASRYSASAVEPRSSLVAGGALPYDRMSAPHFHPPSSGLTVGEIATLTGAVPQRGRALDTRITGVAPLDRAGPGDLSFLDRATHAGDAQATDAGVCLTIERYAEHVPPHVGMMFVKQPYRAFVEVACKLFPDALRPS